MKRRHHVGFMLELGNFQAQFGIWGLPGEVPVSGTTTQRGGSKSKRTNSPAR